MTELFYNDGKLSCDRDKTTLINLIPPVVATNAPFKVNIRADATKELGAWPEVWRFFGPDEPNYAYMANGRKLLGELGELKPKKVYFSAPATARPHSSGVQLEFIARMQRAI